MSELFFTPINLRVFRFRWESLIDELEGLFLDELNRHYSREQLSRAVLNQIESSVDNLLEYPTDYAGGYAFKILSLERENLPRFSELFEVHHA